MNIKKITSIIKSKIKYNYNRAKQYVKQNGVLNSVKKYFNKIIYKINFYNSIKIKKEKEKYKQWIIQNEPNKEELDKQRNIKFAYTPKISIVIPLYNTPIHYFEELVECLLNQTYINWELCLADGSPKKNERIEQICKRDIRIKYIFLSENKGISQNTNEALKLATGEYVALVDHDDLLPDFCLFEIVKCINNNPNVEFIYTDEDKFIDSKDSRYDPHFKPDYAPDTLKSNNYITHLSVFKIELMNKLGGFREQFDGAQDYDIIIRAIEETNNIIHIPKVLYHWRVHPSSTSMVASSKPYAFEAGKMVVEQHLKRLNIEGEVKQSSEAPGIYEIKYKVLGDPKVSIIIPNKDSIKLLKKCIDSIIKKTTYNNYEIIIVENNSERKSTFKYYKKLQENPKINIVFYPQSVFNYSSIINYGVKRCSGDFVVQLNNDTELITPDWLEKFIGYAQRKEIGAVGARLYYSDKSIQHAGMAIGIGGIVANLYTRVPYGIHAYFAREVLIANVTGVTGACLFCRKEIYEEVGYMDENDFKVAFNDADFCLKIREKGYLIVYNPYIELMHYESKTRGYEDTPEKKKRFEQECEKFRKKWSAALKAGDPYYNINFSRKTNQCNVKTEKVFEDN